RNEQEREVLQGAVQPGWQGSPAEVLHHRGKEAGGNGSHAGARSQARWRQEEVMMSVGAPRARGASTTPRLARVEPGVARPNTAQPGPNRTRRTHRVVRAQYWYQRENSSCIIR